MYNILVLDDQPSMVNAMSRVISRMPEEWLDSPCQVLPFNNPLEALRSFDQNAYDVVISDLHMPVMGGLAFLRQAREFQPAAMRIVVSGQGDLPEVLAAVNEIQIFRYVPKPWNDMEFQLAVFQAMQAGKLQRENQCLADQVRVQRGQLSEQDALLREMELESPGITRLNLDANGAIYLDEESV
ncbi:MAG: response regulator [Rhodanobacter sp.]